VEEVLSGDIRNWTLAWDEEVEMGSSENHVVPRAEVPRGDEMRTPDEVAAMLRLKALGGGIKRIARELGCSHMTVRRYVAEGGYVPYRRRGRPRAGGAGRVAGRALAAAC